MKNTIEQFYSLFREAMFANKLTASDISARKGVHYTYVYNSIRGNNNITLQTAQSLAEAAGYHLTLSFDPIDARSLTLTGNMDPTGPLYSERRKSKTETTPAVPAVEVNINISKIATSGTGSLASPTLEDEIAQLLAVAEGNNA